MDFLSGYTPVAEMNPPNTGTICFTPLLPATLVINQISYSLKAFENSTLFSGGGVNVAPSGSLGPVRLYMDRC